MKLLKKEFTSDGKVGIGTTSPSSLCTIKRATTGVVTVLQLQNTNTQQDDGAKILFTAGESTDGAAIGSGGQALHSADLRFFTGGSNERFWLQTNGQFVFKSYIGSSFTTSSGANMHLDNGNGNIFRSTSSKKYKTNIVDTAKGLAELLKLRPVDFNSICENDDQKKLKTGFIAEEVS